MPVTIQGENIEMMENVSSHFAKTLQSLPQSTPATTQGEELLWWWLMHAREKIIQNNFKKSEEILVYHCSTENLE